MTRRLREAASAAGPLPAAIAVVVLVHTLGNFAYMTIWRTATAPDFDVNDFKAYYAGALALEEGRRDLLYPDPATLNLGLLPDQPWVRFAVERGVPHPSAYIYPPLLAVALRPLTALSYHRANQAWLLANLALLAAAIVLLAGRRPGRADLLAAGAVVFTSLNFYPTFRAVQCGQVGPLMLFLLAAALWCLERGRDASAGVLVAAAAAVKLTPGILILWFVAARRYRAAAWAAGSGAALAALSVAGAGWANHVTFVSEMLPVLSRGAATFANQSLAGAAARIFTDVTMNAFEFAEEPAWLRLSTRGGSALLLGVSLWLAGRHARRGGGPGAGYALVLLASLLASPISWEHHFVLALIPIAVLIGDSGAPRSLRGGEAGALIGGYVLLAANAYDLIRRHFPWRIGRLAISYAFLGALILTFLLVRRCLEEPEAAAPRDAAADAARGGPERAEGATA